MPRESASNELSTAMCWGSVMTGLSAATGGGKYCARAVAISAATGAGKIGTVGCRPQVRLIDGGQATTMVARRRQTRWRKIDTMPSISPHSREHCYRRAGPTSRVSRRKKMGLKFDPPASGPRPMKLVRISVIADSHRATSGLTPLAGNVVQFQRRKHCTSF